MESETHAVGAEGGRHREAEESRPRGARGITDVEADGTLRCELFRCFDCNRRGVGHGFYRIWAPKSIQKACGRGIPRSVSLALSLRASSRLHRPWDVWTGSPGALPTWKFSSDIQKHFCRSKTTGSVQSSFLTGKSGESRNLGMKRRYIRRFLAVIHAAKSQELHLTFTVFRELHQHVMVLGFITTSTSWMQKLSQVSNSSALAGKCQSKLNCRRSSMDGC